MLVFDPHALRRELQTRQLSLAELARQLNIPVTNVSGWVNGRHRPALGSVERISQVLGIPVHALMADVTDFTPGPRGAVGLSQAQSLLTAVAVALVNTPDPNALVGDWIHRLKPSEQQALMERLMITPRWTWAWETLQRLGHPDHPLSPYTIQLRLIPPGSARRAITHD